MESLYEACSSLIEHKRFSLSGIPDEAFMKYIHIQLLFKQNNVCPNPRTALSWIYVVCFLALRWLSFWLHSQLVPHLIPAFRPPSQHFPYSSVLFTRLRRRLLYPRHVHRHRTPHQIYIKKEKPFLVTTVARTLHVQSFSDLKCHSTITD